VVVLDDFDRDGAPDLAIANRLAGSVSIGYGNANLTFSPLAPYPIDLWLRTPADTARVSFRDGLVDPGAAPSKLWKPPAPPPP